MTAHDPLCPAAQSASFFCCCHALAARAEQIAQAILADERRALTHREAAAIARSFKGLDIRGER